MPDKPSNPFAVHDAKPAVGKAPRKGDDLNELVRMFQSTGGTIQ